MYISKFQILNYKSFRDSGWLEFKPGINIIVGTNNSGKTALLEALELRFKDNPYRNIRLRDIPDSDLPDESVANITFRLEKSEISTLEEEIYVKNENDRTIFQEWFDKTKEIEVTTSRYLPESNHKSTLLISNCPIEVEVDIRDFGDFMFDKFFGKLKTKRYRFHAERFHIGSCHYGDSLILKPSASNLAEVINKLQLRGRRKMYEKFNKYANLMFPEIQEVSARIQKKNYDSYEDYLDYLEVLVWSPEALEKDKEDLALKLSDCGTGVSQVLAMLYLIVTSSKPNIIIIDEPQSFLHPNLIRKLINIFKEFPQHQYFIATHSPTVISEANPATILQLSYSDGETKTKIINSKETTELRYLLKDLGVSLSDVFGADAILWVEGPTEELCFPRILEKFGYFSTKGIQIMAVKNTGDLEGKRAHIIFDIYDKLSGGNTLFPPAIGFILDSENRTKKEKQDISKRGKEKVEFLERCTYENFLLHPQAIIKVLKQENPSLEIDRADIENYIDEAKNQKRFLPKNCELEDWESQANGAELIKEIFSKFSNNTVEYRKTKHSLEITNWLLEYEPTYLQKLAEFLKRIIKA